MLGMIDGPSPCSLKHEPWNSRRSLTSDGRRRKAGQPAFDVTKTALIVVAGIAQVEQLQSAQVPSARPAGRVRSVALHVKRDIITANCVRRHASYLRGDHGEVQRTAGPDGGARSGADTGCRDGPGLGGGRRAVQRSDRSVNVERDQAGLACGHPHAHRRGGDAPQHRAGQQQHRTEWGIGIRHVGYRVGARRTRQDLAPRQSGSPVSDQGCPPVGPVVHYRPEW